jgi:signal peptidase I
LGCLFEVVETLVLTVIIFLVIQNFVAQPYQVMQESMQHTLEQGQYVLVDKLTPRFGSYQRGDIVVFNSPEGGPVPFIKRVIGVPGDRVEIRDGSVFVNDVELTEPYIFDGDDTQPTGEQTSYTVPADALFVMGDHRGNSTDSRVFGPVEREKVIGRAVLRYWPIDTLQLLQRPAYPGLTADVLTVAVRDHSEGVTVAPAPDRRTAARHGYALTARAA